MTSSRQIGPVDGADALDERAPAAKELDTHRAVEAVVEAIQTAGRSPEAAGIKVSEGPGHPLVYDLRIPDAIARDLGLGAGADEIVEERIGRRIDVAGSVTILRTETGEDFTIITLRLGSSAPAKPGPASAVEAGLGATAGRRNPARQFPRNASTSPRRHAPGGPTQSLASPHPGQQVPHRAGGRGR